jgi:hypothetical protein
MIEDYHVKVALTLKKSGQLVEVSYDTVMDTEDKKCLGHANDL